VNAITRAKQKLPLPQLLQHFRIKTPSLKRNFTIKCPLHAEKNGSSFSVWLKNGTQWLWKCHGKCQCGGDEITFIEKFEGLSKADAIKRYLTLAGVSAEKKTTGKRRSAVNSELDFQPLPPEKVQTVAHWRGIKPETVQWASDRGYIGLNHGHIAFPVFNELGDTVRAHTRFDNGEWKYLPLTDATVSPLVIGRTSSICKIHVFESQWDWLAAVDKLGAPAIECAIITRGAGNGTKVHGLIPQTAVVFAWSQNDSAASQWLKDINKNTAAKVHGVVTPHQHKDVNDWTKAGATKTDLEHAINSSTAIEKPAAPELSVLVEETFILLRDNITFSSEHQAVLTALWIAHTYVIDLFCCTPYLHITSPAKRCGKSNLLTCLKYLVAKAWYAIMPSPAVLYRKIERDCPTLLLDEADRAFADGENGSQDLVAIFNAGYKRGATVDRCGGANRDRLESFHVFCPKAFAGIGGLPDTTEDRCLQIRLERQTQRLRRRFLEATIERETAEIREGFADWAQTDDAKNKLTVSILNSAFPDCLSDRAVEVCEPIYKIAIAAAGNWFSRARTATEVLLGGEEDESRQALQLAAIREAFEQDERLATADLIERLLQQDESPFPNSWFRNPTPSNKVIGKSLARMLKAFGIRVRQLRIDGEKEKGYDRADFEPVWQRYCKPLATPVAAEIDVPEVPPSAYSAETESYDGTSLFSNDDLRTAEVPL
jgi:Protein of unknown function (DUF3631)/CHC2 zinc finger